MRYSTRRWEDDDVYQKHHVHVQVLFAKSSSAQLQYSASTPQVSSSWYLVEYGWYPCGVACTHVNSRTHTPACVCVREFTCVHVACWAQPCYHRGIFLVFRVCVCVFVCVRVGMLVHTYTCVYVWESVIEGDNGCSCPERSTVVSSCHVFSLHLLNMHTYVCMCARIHACIHAYNT